MSDRSLPESLADSVVLTIKAALGPVLERLATAEQSNRDLQIRLQDVVGLRDRLVTVETKAAMPMPTQPEPATAELMTPLAERIAGLEARLAVLGDLRDRVVIAEAKAAIPDHDWSDDVERMLNRIGTLEARAANPSTADIALMEIRDKLLSADLTKDMSALRERLAVVEVRPVLPGPQGDPGAPGKDGVDGKDGSAGLSFEGVYQDGKSYDLGHLVTWAGSSWHCNEATTTKPGDGSKAWTLMVKRGRDGRDGHDAPGALPVVSVGRPQ